MDLVTFFSLTMVEMGLDPVTLIIIIIASIIFIAGFVKSSRENEYKKLMDYYTNKPKDKTD